MVLAGSTMAVSPEGVFSVWACTGLHQYGVQHCCQQDIAYWRVCVSARRGLAGHGFEGFRRRDAGKKGREDCNRQ